MTPPALYQHRPALYRHRPTVVRAIKYTPDSIDAVQWFLATTWPGGYQFSDDGGHLLIETPEGDRDCSAEDGYWIVEGVAHELYCVRPDVFARVYEPALEHEPGPCTGQSWSGEQTLVCRLLSGHGGSHIYEPAGGE